MHQHTHHLVHALTAIILTFGQSHAAEGVARVTMLNYPDCIELSNSDTRVVLCHHVGGRVLSYEHKGTNILYLAAGEASWKPGIRKPEVSAGRFDVGPEMFQTRGHTLWSGIWDVEITGDRSAKMTSKKDPGSGFLVTRDFSLARDSSHLTFTQTVTNLSDKTTRHCYWSRTFAVHGGSAIVPLTPEQSRFPSGYAMYNSGSTINVRPSDPAIRREGNFLVITGPPARPKLGMDSTAGWVAYQTRQDLLFVKRYTVNPDKTYGEATGINLSLWYPKASSLPTCEIEPIGPMERLAPGESASFTVHWWLLDHPHPEKIDPEKISKIVETQCLYQQAKR